MSGTGKCFRRDRTSSKHVTAQRKEHRSVECGTTSGAHEPVVVRIPVQHSCCPPNTNASLRLRGKSDKPASGLSGALLTPSQGCHPCAHIPAQAPRRNSDLRPTTRRVCPPAATAGIQCMDLQVQRRWSETRDLERWAFRNGGIVIVLRCPPEDTTSRARSQDITTEFHCLRQLDSRYTIRSRERASSKRTELHNGVGLQ